MFALSNLVGAPRTSGSRLEFTPIGRRRNEDPTPESETHINRALNADKVNNTLVESSFDDTSDRFDTLQSFEARYEAKEPRNGGKTSPMFDNMFRPRLALVEGTNSIQELLHANKQLEAENYNLKIEVATLTKFVKQSPEEQRGLAVENVQLKQQLMEALQRLEARDLPLESPESFNSMRSLYKEIIEEREHEIHRLNTKVSELEHKLRDTRAVDDALGKLEFLQAENQSLRRKLDAATSNSLELGEIQAENNDLKSRVFELEREVQQNQQGESLERQLRAVTQDLEQTAHERDSAQSALSHARKELLAREADLEALRRDQSAAESRTAAAAGSRLQEVQSELLDEKARLRRGEAQHRDETARKDAEIARLSLKVDSLARELQNKEKDVHELRAEVRALMDERSAAFDNKSTLQHYEAQIDALQSKTASLEAENRRLKSESAKLHDELFSASSGAENAAKLRADTRELESKLDFYEKEYALLQDAMENAEAEADALRAKEQRAQSQIGELGGEIDRLAAKLRRAELSESQKYNESALYEVESAYKKRGDAERVRLEKQIEALQLQVRKLEQELRRAQAQAQTLPSFESPAAPSPDYQKLLKERSKLQMDIDDKELQLAEQKRKYAKLEAVVRDKDLVAEALEQRIRDLNREFRSSALGDDAAKSDVLRLEHQLRALQLDSDRVQRDLEEQLRYYKTKLDVFMEREQYERGSAVSSTAAATAATSSVVALLESQLEEMRRLNKELAERAERLAQADQAKHSEQNLQLESEKRQSLEEKRQLLSEKRQLLEENLHLLSENLQLLAQNRQLQKESLQLHKENLQFSETVDALESDARALRADKSRLEQKARTLAQELARTSKHCTKLASRLSDMDAQESRSAFRSADDGLRARKTAAQLQGQIDVLNAKLAATQLGGTQLGASPAKSSSRATTEVRLLKNELQYYKAKLFDLNMRANDLALVNRFVASSIKNSSEAIKNDIVKLSRRGIHPDYADMEEGRGTGDRHVRGNGNRSGNGLTLKVLATFVLSMVRLKNRLKRAEDRRARMLQLRGDIDRDKITLLAEQ